MESDRHLGIKFLQYFFLRPVEVHIILNALEVGASHAAGVAQKVGDDEDVILHEIFIRIGRGRTVRAFRNQFDALGNRLDSVRVNLSFFRRRDQNVHILSDPSVAVFDDITSLLGFRSINRAVLIHNGQQEARINSVFVAVREDLLLVAVIARDASHFAAEHFYKTNRSVLRDIAKTLNRRDHFFGIKFQMLQGFAHGVNHAVAGRFGASERAAAAERFASYYAGRKLTRLLGIFIHHPAHHLRGRANIGSGHVLARTNVAPNVLHPTAAQSFFFGGGKRGGIHNYAAFTAAQRNIGDGAFPSHPHGKRAHGIHRLVSRETNAAFVRTARIVVLNTKACEDLQGTVIHAYRNAERKLARWVAQHFSHFWLQVKFFGDMIKLFLRHCKSIKLF